MSNKKLGFWAVFALVTGSQIGTGILILPANLSKFGLISVYSWGFSIIGVLSLAMVFANLCEYFPNSAGPHAYVNEIFGKTSAFFLGWTYWIVSWISSTAVTIEAISYLSPLIGVNDALTQLILEIVLLILIAALNLRGTQAAGSVEIILSTLKILPLIIVPIYAIGYFNIDNFIVDESVKNDSYSTNYAKVILLTVWGFVGLECATVATGAVKNPGKIIPRALICGTLSVAFLYFFNIIGIMGLIKGSDLMNMRAPYAEAVRSIFGGQWHLLISFVASIVCIGTLNAWTLVSGQIALSLAKSGLMPEIFAKQNERGAPVFAIIISILGIIILLLLTTSENVVNQVTEVINFSTTSFLFVYFICSIGLLKFLLTLKNRSFIKLLTTLIAIFFSSWVIYQTPINTLLIASLFTISGLPIYILCYRKNDKK